VLLRRREQEFRSLLGRAALLMGLAAGPGCAGNDGLSRTDFRARADSICASDGERLDVMIAGFERGFAGADDIARASRAGDDAAFRAAAADAIRSMNDARFAAAEYGLDACPRLGRP
jgi:nitroreductase